MFHKCSSNNTDIDLPGEGNVSLLPLPKRNAELLPTTYTPPLDSVLKLLDLDHQLGGGLGGTIEINLAQGLYWRPRRTLPVVRSTHLLDLACSDEALRQLRTGCEQEETTIVAYHPHHPLLRVTTKNLRRLLSYSSPISDSIMTFYLEKLTARYNISYLATSFIYTLRLQGWDRLQSYFAMYRNRPRTNSRPRIHGEPAIILPCFVDGCHWVTVVRREVNGATLFLYADDMNNATTELDIKTLLSQHTSPDFYPASATWIKCHSYTYKPHSNECGPRSLLAATVLSLHPNPSPDILLPVMHHNLAQILRTWLGVQIVQDEFDSATITSLLALDRHDPLLSTNQTSDPADLIAWPSSISTPPNASSIRGPFLNSNLNPLAPVFLPRQVANPTISKRQQLVRSRLANSTRTYNETNKNITNKLMAVPNKMLKPTKRTQIVLPGQTVLSKYFQKTSRLLKSKVIPPSTSVPFTQSTSRPQVSTQTQQSYKSPIPQQQTQTSVTTQRTLFDFHYFKPYAAVSDSDPDTWGHTPESIDTSSTFRILLQNPNGIKPSVTEPEFLFSLHLCHEIGIGAICLAETNLNWNNSQHHISLRRCLYRNWKATKFQTSVPEERFLGNYQPGGTATIVTDRWTSRVVTCGSDPLGLGRWSFIVLRGKQDTNICIVTAYRVCNDKYTGPKTAYQQQRRHLSSLFRKQGKVINPDPHRQFILDLQAWIEFKQAEGMQIILTLDNNEELSPNIGQLEPSSTTLLSSPIINVSHDGTLETLIRSTGLVDILRHQHPSKAYPPTYNRGKKRIDYILVSSSLLSAVTRSGILPYNAIFQGDHRPCFIDIDVSKAFDGKTPELCPPCQRQLQLHDPRIIKKYLETLHQQFKIHNIPEKVKALQQEHSEWTDHHQLEYEKLDKLITESMLYAERQSSSRYTKTYEWSPTLIQAVYAERYWRLQLRRSQGRHVTNGTLTRARVLAGLSIDPHPLRLPDILQCLAAARQSRKLLQKNHHGLRQNYLQQLAEALVLKRAPYLEGDPTYEERLSRRTAKEVKRLIRLERKRYLYRIIGNTLNDSSFNSGGLTRIDIPAPADPNVCTDPKTWKGPWRSVTDPEEIATHICAINTKQYHQAFHTPFGSGYLADTIGFNLEKPGAKAIIDSTFTIDPTVSLLPETKRILAFLTNKKSPPPSFPSGITPAEFRSTYKLVKERTSSSVSGRHVGHYKAATQDDIISQVHATMMSLPFTIGFSPVRWRKVVDVMLEKEPGNPKLHRLRIIALIESDFNQAQRILIARRLTHQMEDTGVIPEMQYGSRPGKLCVSPVLNKQLTHDIIRQTKQTAAIIENDAVGCYDRLVNPLVLLSMRRMGVPESPAQCIALTWSGTSHSIKTQYGISKVSYTNNPTTPLFGPGQGSTTGPTLWQMSFVILEDSALGSDADEDVPQLMLLKAAGADIELDNPGEAFVDDSNLGSTSSLSVIPHQVTQVDQQLHCVSAVQHLHTLAQRWERALFSIGGAINFSKSFWFVFHWKWKNGVASLVPPPEHVQLHLTEGDRLDEPVPVPSKSVHDTYRTLGVHVSPSGNTQAAMGVLYDKAQDYQAKIMKSTLPKEAALLSYTMYLLPKLGYPLPTMTLSEDICHKLQSPTLMALLPKLHLNRHIARSIVFGSIRYGGLGLKSLYSVQSLGQLTLFVGHLRARDKSSKLLRISLSHLQLAVGSTTSVFDLSASAYSDWVDHTWLSSFWSFLCRVKLGVCLHTQWLPVKTREHDVVLMDYFLSQGYKAVQIGRLNRCRLYLQSITLADITSADGTCIIPDILLGIPLLDRKSNLEWPCQQRPPNSDWVLWAQALRLLQPRSKLEQPLGRWLTSSPHQSWFWFMDPSSTNLYKCGTAGTNWQRFPSLVNPKRRTRTTPVVLYDISQGSEIPPPQQPLLPSTVSYDPYTNLSVATAGPRFLDQPTISEEPKTLHNLLSGPLYFRPIMPTRLPTEEELIEIAEACKTELYAVSRTHWDSLEITYSWAFLSQQPSGILVNGAATCAVVPHVSTAKRAELEGILHILFILQTVCAFHTVTTGNITVLCLSKGVTTLLQRVRYRGISSALNDNDDIITAIRHYLREFPSGIKVSFTHYDLSKPSHDIAFATKCIQDLSDLITSTKEAIQDLPSSREYLPPPHSEVTLQFNGSPLTTRIRSTLRRALYENKILATICKQEGWTESLFHQVDWGACEYAMQRTWSCKRIAYTKLNHALLNTNAQNKKFYRKSDLCPCCSMSPETLTHVFTCPSPEVANFRNKQQEILWTNLNLIHTPDKVLHSIKAGIIGLASKQSRDDFIPAFHHQTQLGWEALLRGRISFMWRTAFCSASEYDSKPNLKWAGQLVLFLLQYSQQLWNFRCGVLHGHSAEECRQKHRETLLTQIQMAYEEHNKDPFHIPSEWRRLFHRPFLSLALSDRDTLSCWLRSYSEACQQQMLLTQHLKATSKRYFSRGQSYVSSLVPQQLPEEPCAAQSTSTRICISGIRERPLKSFQGDISSLKDDDSTSDYDEETSIVSLDSIDFLEAPFEHLSYRPP